MTLLKPLKPLQARAGWRALVAAALAAVLLLHGVGPTQALVIRGATFKGAFKGGAAGAAAAVHPHGRVEIPELLRPVG